MTVLGERKTVEQKSIKEEEFSEKCFPQPYTQSEVRPTADITWEQVRKAESESAF